VHQDPAQGCTIQWRLAILGSGPVKVSGVSVEQWTENDKVKRINDIEANALASVTIKKALQDVNANLIRDQLSSSVEKSLDHAYTLAEVARRASGIRATALSMSAIKARAELNDPSKYVKLDSILSRARRIMPVPVGQQVMSLADRVIASIVKVTNGFAGNTIVQAVATLTTGLPIGELGRTLSMEVSRASTKNNALDMRFVGDKLGGEAKGNPAKSSEILESMTTQFRNILEKLAVENETVAQYGRELETVQVEARSVRNRAQFELRLIFVLAGADSIELRVDRLLDPVASLNRNSPAFAQLETPLRKAFNNALLPDKYTEAARTTSQVFLTRATTRIEDASKVASQYQDLTCRMRRLYKALGDDLSRAQVLSEFSPELQKTWTEKATPALVNIKQADREFQEAYGGQCLLD